MALSHDMYKSLTVPGMAGAHPSVTLAMPLPSAKSSSHPWVAVKVTSGGTLGTFCEPILESYSGKPESSQASCLSRVTRVCGMGDLSLCPLYSFQPLPLWCIYRPR